MIKYDPDTDFLPPLTRRCRECRGVGLVEGAAGSVDCPECDGAGTVLTRAGEQVEEIVLRVMKRGPRPDA